MLDFCVFTLPLQVKQKKSLSQDLFFFLSIQDDEINQQSQLMEKLKEQMLDQEEVSSVCVCMCVGGGL